MPSVRSIRRFAVIGTALVGTCMLIAANVSAASASNVPHSSPASASKTGGVPNRTVTTATLPAIRHVFVIMLENNGYSATFGSPASDPYLATTLPSRGVLLKDYYGIGHFSNDNYIGFVSGQPPNKDNQADCAGSGFVNFPFR